MNNSGITTSGEKNGLQVPNNSLLSGISFNIEALKQNALVLFNYRPDYYLDNPPMQPKREIADYVEQNGILVPRRFTNLQEALEYVRQGGEILVRSEHSDEYNGISGLLDSYTINQSIIQKGKEYYEKHGKDIDWDKFNKDCSQNAKWDVLNQILGQIEDFSQADLEEYLKRLSKRIIEKYCELLGINMQEFKDKISYSYWEKLGGYNRSIIADSSISGRYHIFTKSTTINFRNYLIIENGKIIQDLPQELTQDLRDKIPNVIAFYEKIRNLERFNPIHCPIIEFQTDKGNDYFLQYHRTRQINPTTFTLDRPLENGEIEAVYVRGATPSEGIIIDTAMYYVEPRKKGEPGYQIMEQEDGSFDFHYNYIFSEIMNRRRKVNFLTKTINHISLATHDGHLEKSKLFNTGISISLPRDSVPKGIVDNLFNQTQETKQVVRVPIKIISDGRKAYIKFIIS